MLIKFTTDGGRLIAVNPETVTVIREITDVLTNINTQDGRLSTVQGTFNEVLAKLCPEPHIGIETVL